MIRATVLVLGLGVVPFAHAELMSCDETKQCQLVCYFPSVAARTEPVYPVTGVAVDRVRIDVVGDHNLLYTAERKDTSTSLATHQPLESFILPKDYPCRLSPVELLHGEAQRATGEAPPQTAVQGTN